MEIELSDASGLPEAFKSFVKQAEDKTILDLGAAVGELERFKGKALKAEQEAIERRKALDAWKGLGETPEAVQQAIADARKGGNADQEKIVSELRAKYEGEIKTRDERFRTVMTERTMSDIKAELAKAGVIPEGLDVLATFAASRIRIQDDGAVSVLSRDGSGPMIGSGANGGATLSDLAKELAGSIPHLVRDDGAGGGGKPPGSNGGKPGKSISAAELGKMTPRDKAAFFAANPGVIIT